jgi:hypothetical protein
VLALQACVFLPRTAEVYDADCQIAARHMVLQPVQIASISGCNNQGCAILLAAAPSTAGEALRGGQRHHLGQHRGGRQRGLLARWRSRGAACAVHAAASQGRAGAQAGE